jgi:thiol-disulfide isomerase/thioredoxin
MHRFAIASLTLALALAGSRALADDERPLAPPLTGVGVWHNVPEDAAWTTEEGAVDLERLRGKVVVLKFWMSWCAGCQAVRPAFNALQKEHADDLIVIGLTQLDDRQGLEVVADYAEEKAEFALGVMQTNQIIADYEVGKIPLALVIDKAGRILWRGSPARDMDGFQAAVKRALAE